jgi:hypothetical protein
MKRIVAGALLLVMASLCHAWGTVGMVNNTDGGAIHLTDRRCNDTSSGYGYAYATGAGPDVDGCWTINTDGDVQVHWYPDGYDDYWRTYERSHFRVTDYGRANGWN